jgi:hypothetical protein
MIFTFAIIGFLDFVHRLVSEKNTFRKLDLFHLSGSGPDDGQSPEFLKEN